MTTSDTILEFVYDDGGRKAAGYKGTTEDCVTRALAIATQLPYQQVYDDLYAGQKVFREGRSRRARKAKARGYTSRDGIYREVYQPYLESHGWIWTPKHAIGQPASVHLRKGELPMGRIICRVTKHLTAVIDGAIHDTYDPSRDGDRMVYGIFTKP